MPIERQVFEGQTLTVQVIKDAIGTKGARLSTQVSIAGRMLVFLPQDNHIGISQKIGSAELRDQLRSRMNKLTATSDGSPTGGFILRTNAEDASDEELGDDIAYLRKAWAAIRAQGLSQPPIQRRHLRSTTGSPAADMRARLRNRLPPRTKPSTRYFSRLAPALSTSCT